MTKSPVPAYAPTGAPMAMGLDAAAAAFELAMGGSAIAQDAAAPAAVPGGGMTEILVQLMPILLLVVIFWLLIFRPQQKRMKAQQAMLSAIRRGDTVVTTGGIVGKVTKAVEGEDLEVEIAQNVRVKIVRGMVSDVRSKAEPVNDNAKTA
jgi:preprotein translocase subunit YajC